MLTAPQFSPAALQSVRARVARAVADAGRAPGSVTLLAVSKLQPVSMIRQAVAAGQVEFGENYVQEGCDKVAALAGVPGLVWHFIGQLQSNKTREVAANFDWVHTIDRLRVAERLSAQRPGALPPLQVLLQVRLADEPGKGGVAPAEVPALAAAVAALPRLRLRGLMCIPPPATDIGLQRRPFQALRELLQSLQGSGFELDTLSMGMSDDLEAAVLEGATIVRVGTAIFGRRPG